MMNTIQALSLHSSGQNHLIRKSTNNDRRWSHRTEEIRAGRAVTGCCGTPDQHRAIQKAEQPDRHAEGSIRAGPVSFCPHSPSLLPAPSLPGLSPGRQSLPGSCWAPFAAAHDSGGGNVNHHWFECKPIYYIFSNYKSITVSHIKVKCCFTEKRPIQTLASLSASRVPPFCSCRSAYARWRAWYSLVSWRKRSSDSSRETVWY